MFISERYCYLFFDVHHLAMDGACISIIMSSIVDAYMGKKLHSDYYCSYLAKEDLIRESPQYLEDKEYFENQYSGYDWCCIPEPDKNDPVPIAAGRVVRFPFDASDLEAAEERLNASRSIIAIAAAILTLHVTTGKNDIMTNWIFNNCLGSFASDSVGMLIKNLPVGIHMDQINGLEELIIEIKKQVTNGIAHCSYDYFAAQESAFVSDPMEVNYQQNMNADELALLHPFQLVLSMVGYMFGSGGSALIASELGDGKTQTAKLYFTMIIKAAASIGVVLAIIGIIFLRPIAVLIGATPEILEYGLPYGRTLFLFLPIMILGYAFQSILITAEKPKFGLYISIGNIFSNLLFDWLFVVVFKWGMIGAATATGIGACQ